MNCKDFYERNLKALKSKDQNLDFTNIDSINEKPLELLKAKNGQLTLKATNDKGSVFIHSPYNPENEAKMWADNAEFGKEDIIVVYGLGLGYHIKHLIKKLNEKNRVIVIEPNPQCLNIVMHHTDISDILAKENVLIKYLQNPKDISVYLALMTESYKRHRIKILKYPSITRLYIKYFKQISQEILDFMTKTIINENTIIHFSRLWIENMLKNLPICLNSPGVKEFYGMFKNKPAIIVSAGPSLDKNRHLLKKAKGKAMLICVDTALKSLVSVGIYPDIVISLDGDPLNVKHFEDLPNIPIPLVMDPMIHYKISEIYTAPKVIINTAFGLENYIHEICQRDFGELKAGGSVACLAFDLACKVGANPIIFVGQDLAFTGNKTHSQGSAYEKKVNPLIIDKKVDDIYGNKVSTSSTMYTFKLWFEEEIEKLKDREVIDATEGGAKIEGTKVMSLNEVLNKYCLEQLPVEEMVKALVKPVKVSSENINTALTKLNELAESLKDIQLISKKGKRQAEKLVDTIKLNPYHINKINNINKKLDRIDQEIQKEKEGKKILDVILQPIIKNTMLDSVDKEDISQNRDSRNKVAKKTFELYKNINEECKYVCGLLDDTCNRIKQEFKEGSYEN